MAWIAGSIVGALALIGVAMTLFAAPPAVDHPNASVTQVLAQPPQVTGTDAQRRLSVSNPGTALGAVTLNVPTGWQGRHSAARLTSHTVLAGLLSAPPVNGFAANIVVEVSDLPAGHDLKAAADAVFTSQSHELNGYRRIGAVTGTTVLGKNAAIGDYTYTDGSAVLSGRLVTANITGHIVLIYLTALTTDFPEHTGDFARTLASLNTSNIGN